VKERDAVEKKKKKPKLTRGPGPTDGLLPRGRKKKFQPVKAGNVGQKGQKNLGAKRSPRRRGGTTKNPKTE